jgi:hypothetical protein
MEALRRSCASLYDADQLLRVGPVCPFVTCDLSSLQVAFDVIGSRLPQLDKQLQCALPSLFSCRVLMWFQFDALRMLDCF